MIAIDEHNRLGGNCFELKPLEHAALIGELTLQTRQIRAEFADQLRQIKAALVERDFVSLSDVLLYETSQTNQRWQAVLAAVRGVICPT